MNIYDWKEKKWKRMKKKKKRRKEKKKKETETSKKDLKCFPYLCNLTGLSMGREHGDGYHHVTTL